MTAGTISGGLDLEVKMARTVQVPELDQADVGELEASWSVRHIRVQIRHKAQLGRPYPGSEAKVLARVCLSGLTQTCPWTQFPGNRLILSWKVEKGKLLSDTACGGDAGAMIENSARKMRPKQTTRPKFVCTVTFILFVFVCAALLCAWSCVCVRALICSITVYVSPSLWAKEGCNLHFCAHVQEQQQIKTPCLKIKWLEN